MENLETPSEELNSFFDALWGDETGYVYLPTRNIDTNEWRKVFFEWPKHSKHISQHCLANSAQGLEVYCAPALFKTPTLSNDAIKGSFVLWTDFDGNAPEKWNDNQHVPEPTLRIQSSQEGHEHVYWRLEEFTTDIQEIEAKNRSLAYTLRSDVSGWDITQILRPPGTFNHKRNLPVVTLKNDPLSFSFEDFKSLKPALVLVNEGIDTATLPDVERVIATYQWDESHYALFIDSNIPEGKRSDALMRLGYFGAEQGMTDSEIYSILDNAATRWDKYTGRTDRHRRLLDIVNRARQKHPVGIQELTFRGLLKEDDSAPEVNTQFVYGLQDLLSSEIEVSWVIEDLLEEGGFGITAAAPNVGKTQLKLQMAICLALGKDFLKWKVPKPQKVMFMSLEMSHAALKRVLRTIAQGYTPEELLLLQENLILVPVGETIPLDRKEGMSFIEALIEDVKPNGVIFDSVSKLFSEKLDDKTALLLNRQYIKLRSKYKVWLWFIHHNRKATGDNKKPRSLADLYGSVFIASEVTSVMMLWTDFKRNSIDVIMVKQRLSEMTEPFRIKRDSNLMFRILDGEEVIVDEPTSSFDRFE